MWDENAQENIVPIEVTKTKYKICQEDDDLNLMRTINDYIIKLMMTQLRNKNYNNNKFHGHISSGIIREQSVFVAFNSF